MAQRQVVAQPITAPALPTPTPTPTTAPVSVVINNPQPPSSPAPASEKKDGVGMKEITHAPFVLAYTLIGVAIALFVLRHWVLPQLGVYFNTEPIAVQREVVSQTKSFPPVTEQFATRWGLKVVNRTGFPVTIINNTNNLPLGQPIAVGSGVNIPCRHNTVSLTFIWNGGFKDVEHVFSDEERWREVFLQ